MEQLLRITHVSDDSSVVMDRSGPAISEGSSLLTWWPQAVKRLRDGPNQHQNNRAMPGRTASGTRNASTGNRVERSHAHFIKLCEPHGSGRRSESRTLDRCRSVNYRPRIPLPLGLTGLTDLADARQRLLQPLRTIAVRLLQPETLLGTNSCGGAVGGLRDG